MTSESLGVAGDLIVGADAIARVTGLKPRTVFYLVAKGELPGAFKLGGQLALSRMAYCAGIAAKVAAGSPRQLEAA